LRTAVPVTGLHPDNRGGTRLAGGRRGGEPKSMSEQGDSKLGGAEIPSRSQGTVNRVTCVYLGPELPDAPLDLSSGPSRKP